MLSRSTSALAIYIPPAIYVAGSEIAGEVEVQFRQLQEENIEEVQLRLRGSSKTYIHLDKTTLYESIKLAHEDLSIWSRGGAYPAPGSDVLRVPFSVRLPEQLPPSFHIRKMDRVGDIRYSLTAVGVRKGILNLNKRLRLPLAILPHDQLGATIKAECTNHGWKTFTKDEKIRKGLWGDYASVHVKLALPDIPILPLFSDIPYTISVTTTTAPLARASAGDHTAGKPLFPAAPRMPDDLEFRLQRKTKVRANNYTVWSTDDAVTFLGEKAAKKSKAEDAPRPAVDVDVPEREWLPEGASLVADEKDEKSRERKDGHVGGGEGKGTWVQRATFRSMFRLDCPPTFAVHNLQCDYKLVVKVPFSGIGNDLKLEVPVNVTSGIDQPLPKEDSNAHPSHPPPTLDLPPAYWNTDDKGWADDEKE